ncbi:lytic transglycosylase domain-containing protein [candidate division KSB1 bacterium]|nr:lytic transglycosylase domain-containing protein [candidate division KSB1 bacterium]
MIRWIKIAIFFLTLNGLPLHTQENSLLESLRDIKKLDFCKEPVPLKNLEVRERFEKEFMLILWDRPQILLYLKRMPRYMPIIEKILRNHDLPDDLKYIAVVESALRPHAGSSKGAMGFWQFTESTGRKYGLEINSSVDERRNIFRATEAAAVYLKSLEDTLDSWTLAAAGYNMGENGLMDEIEKQGVFDFYHLYLPLETQRFILRIVVMKQILSNPGEYGFNVSRNEAYPIYRAERVNVYLDHVIPTKLIALAAGTNFKEIKDLNPELRGYDMPIGERSILIPRGSGKHFHKKLDQLILNWIHAESERFN